MSQIASKIVDHRTGVQFDRNLATPKATIDATSNSRKRTFHVAFRNVDNRSEPEAQPGNCPDSRRPTPSWRPSRTEDARRIALERDLEATRWSAATSLIRAAPLINLHVISTPPARRIRPPRCSSTCRPPHAGVVTACLDMNYNGNILSTPESARRDGSSG